MARLNPTNFATQNFYSAVLTGDITAGTLTIGLDTVPAATSGILVIEPDSTTNREVILYTSKGASTITCPSDGRGFDGSTAVPHLTGTTIIMAPVKRIFDALASGELSTDPMRTEFFYDHINADAVWSGDSYGSTRNASLTAGVAYILGRRITIPVVSARSFTASRDTYIDITDAGDGTATLTYTEVTNNAASPALATNALRLGIIVTGASNIAAVGSVNQGQEGKILPIASSNPYAVTDSLGNLICPRDPTRRVIGHRQMTANVTGVTTNSDILIVPCVIPSGRKVKVSAYLQDSTNSADVQHSIDIRSASGGGGTNYQRVNMKNRGAGLPTGTMSSFVILTLAAGATTIYLNFIISGGTATAVAQANLLVELV